MKYERSLQTLMGCLEIRGNYEFNIKKGVMLVKLFNENKGLIVKAESPDPAEIVKQILP